MVFEAGFRVNFVIVFLSFVSRRFSQSVVRGTREYLICSYKCWRRISSCFLTRILLESPCSISNMMLKCVDIHIVEGSLEVKLPTMRTDEKQRWEESEKRREEER